MAAEGFFSTTGLVPTHDSFPMFCEVLHQSKLRESSILLWFFRFCRRFSSDDTFSWCDSCSQIPSQCFVKLFFNQNSKRALFSCSVVLLLNLSRRHSQLRMQTSNRISRRPIIRRCGVKSCSEPHKKAKLERAAVVHTDVLSGRYQEQLEPVQKALKLRWWRRQLNRWCRRSRSYFSWNMFHRNAGFQGDKYFSSLTQDIDMIGTRRRVLICVVLVGRHTSHIASFSWRWTCRMISWRELWGAAMRCLCGEVLICLVIYL